MLVILGFTINIKVVIVTIYSILSVIDHVEISLFIFHLSKYNYCLYITVIIYSHYRSISLLFLSSPKRQRCLPVVLLKKLLPEKMHLEKHMPTQPPRYNQKWTLYNYLDINMNVSLIIMI